MPETEVVILVCIFYGFESIVEKTKWEETFCPDSEFQAGLETEPLRK